MVGSVAIVNWGIQGGLGLLLAAPQHRHLAGLRTGVGVSRRALIAPWEVHNQVLTLGLGDRRIFRVWLSLLCLQFFSQIGFRTAWLFKSNACWIALKASGGMAFRVFGG